MTETCFNCGGIPIAVAFNMNGDPNVCSCDEFRHYRLWGTELNRYINHVNRLEKSETFYEGDGQ